MKKNDRIWATRNEAIAILAVVATGMSGEQLVAKLFNSSDASVARDVAAAREKAVAAIRAQRAAEDALLAASQPQTATVAATGTDNASANAAQTVQTAQPETPSKGKGK